AVAGRYAALHLLSHRIRVAHDLPGGRISALGELCDHRGGHRHDAGHDLVHSLARALERIRQTGYRIGSTLENTRVCRSNAMRTCDACPTSTSDAAPIAGLTFSPQALPITSASVQKAATFFSSAGSRSVAHRRVTAIVALEPANSASGMALFRNAT